MSDRRIFDADIVFPGVRIWLGSDKLRAIEDAEDLLRVYKSVLQHELPKIRVRTGYFYCERCKMNHRIEGKLGKIHRVVEIIA